MIDIIRRAVFCSTVALGLIASLPAGAGGPSLNCGSGVPVLWPRGGVNIPFNPDRGTLGALSNAEAVAAVQGAFDVWGAVPSSTVSYVNAGPLPVDVDITNYTLFLFAPEPDGLSAIVFDDTGEIFDDLFGPNSGVLGIAGPEWVDVDAAPCTSGVILESLALLNGPAFTNAVAARDVMVHEFGHYTGLGHSVVNGQNVAFGDPTGPAPFTFGNAPANTVETMYPFYFGPGSDSQTLERDDIATLSALYPEPTFFGSTGTISGTIISPNGTTRLTGINVIARNLANPIGDAVSAISGNMAFDASTTDPRAGAYTLSGLTPGAHYAVYIDGLLAGQFSTTPRPLRDREEFFNGADESVEPSLDDPTAFTPIVAQAGSPVTGTNILINRPAPGPLTLGGSDAIEIFPHFPLSFCGVEYESFFINANGDVTFGDPDPFFSGPAEKEGFLMMAPRIAGLRANLHPPAGGTVSFAETANDVTVTFTDVPEFSHGGANTFSIRMFRAPASTWTTSYGAVSANGGLAGFSCGPRAVSGFELPSRLTPIVWARMKPAVFERLDAAHDTLSNRTFIFAGPRGLHDTFEGQGDASEDKHSRNDTFDTATPIELPFQSARGFSTIEPLGGDVDYYGFTGRAGDIVAIEIVPGNRILNARIGLFRRGPGGVPLLVRSGFSREVVRLDTSGRYAVAVSTEGDPDFTGAGTDFGRYNLSVIRYQGEFLAIGSSGIHAVEVPFGFSFPFQGRTWSSVFVNDAGTLTFGGADDDPFAILSVERFLAGPPRIAPVAVDLSPSANQVIAERTGDSLTIHFVGVRSFITDDPYSYSTEMRRDGRIRNTYFALDALRGSGLAGVTPGGGVSDPGPVDLSQRSVWPATGTTYQPFSIDLRDIDLSFRSVTFKP